MEKRKFKRNFQDYVINDMLKEKAQIVSDHCQRCHGDKESKKVCIDYEREFFLCDDCILELGERIS